MTSALRTYRLFASAIVAGGFVGCATSNYPVPHQLPTTLPLLAAPVVVHPTVESAPAPLSVPTRVRPAYAQIETLAIDLPTVLQLVNANSPAIHLARAKVREAEARLQSAKVVWLPNLTVGTIYNHFDGQTQNQAGLVFARSRGNLFGLGGAALTLDTADAIYRPLIEHRLAAAEQFREHAVSQTSELEAISAYLDLLQLFAQLELNADLLAKVETLQAVANTGTSAVDNSRAQTEVLLRKTERLDLQGRAAIASSRLGKLLLLQPNISLTPRELAVVPITLIDPNTTLETLLETALAHRPDLAANREVIAAAWQRVRQQEKSLLLPKVAVTNQVGSFGGGFNDDLSRFQSRNVLSVQVYWEVKNLGFGTHAETAQRRAVRDQIQSQTLETQARATAEIVETAQLAAVKYETLDLAERALREATELYRLQTTPSTDAKQSTDPVRPLQALQLLNTTRQTFLSTVIEFNRTQYRLLTLLGNPPSREIAP